jgi:hypothetical protein
MGMVRQVPGSGMGQVPQMGRWPGTEKCRRQGGRTGAGDGDTREARVSVYAADHHERTQNAFRLNVARAEIFRVQGILRPW